MKFILHDCEQRSEQWRALRLGKVCGSTAADFLATHRDGKTPAASRRNLLTQLVLERITGRSHENGYQSRFMEQGIEREGDALELYEIVSGNLIFKAGFLQHPTLAAGVSLDGYVGEHAGIIEAKSPIPAVHLEFIETGKIPGEYLKQITHGLFISGAEWADYVSFNPDFPEPLDLKIVHVEAKQIDLAAYEGLLKAFLAEVDQKEASVRSLMGQKRDAA